MSKTDFECLYGFRKDVERTPRPPGLPARIGTLTHLMLERALADNPEPVTGPLGEVSEAKRIFVQLWKWVEPRRSRVVLFESGLRYDSVNDTATLGPRRGEPGYQDVPDHVLPGTLDLVLADDDGFIVLDVKTGKKENAHVEQLHAQGLAVARMRHVDRARVGFLFPRKTKCDEPVLETLDADMLDAEAGRLHRKLRLIPTGQPDPSDNECWRCDARPYCPAFQAERDAAVA